MMKQLPIHPIACPNSIMRIDVKTLNLLKVSNEEKITSTSVSKTHFHLVRERGKNFAICFTQNFSMRYIDRNIFHI